jgi:hypothetical protein
LAGPCLSAAASADDHSFDFAALNESVNFVAAASLSRYASIVAGPYCGSILTAA